MVTRHFATGCNKFIQKWRRCVLMTSSVKKKLALVSMQRRFQQFWGPRQKLEGLGGYFGSKKGSFISIKGLLIFERSYPTWPPCNYASVSMLVDLTPRGCHFRSPSIEKSLSPIDKRKQKETRWDMNINYPRVVDLTHFSYGPHNKHFSSSVIKNW